MGLSLSKLRERVKDREAYCEAIHGVAKSWTWIRGWTTATKHIHFFIYLSYENIVFSNRTIYGSIILCHDDYYLYFIFSHSVKH